MSQKINLSDRLGIVAQQGQEPYLSWFIGADCKLFYVNASWPVCEPVEGEYDFEWLKIMRDKVYGRGGQILPNLFSMPGWSDPTQPLIEGWTFNAVGMWKAERMKDRFLQYVDVFCREFPDIKNVVFENETNIYRRWRDPKRPFNPVPRSALDFMELAVKPAAEVAHDNGKRVIAGSPTLRGQDSRDFAEALGHFTEFRAANKPNENEQSLKRVADFLDIHVYHDKGAAGVNVVNDIKKFFMHFERIKKPIKYPIYITETGFNEGECFTELEQFGRAIKGFFGGKVEPYTGEMKQARNYKRVLEFLETDKKKPVDEQQIKQLYAFEMFDPPDRKGDFNGLLKLNPDGSVRPKPAALLLREYWQA